jgi:hypothetical protein
MNVKKTYTLLCLIGLIPVFVSADQVIFQDETRSDGKICSADQDYIYLQTDDTTIIKIPQQNVRSVFFSYSDLVYLQSGKVIECKIVDRSITELIVVTDQGLLPVKLVELKNYFFNAADSLTVPYLLYPGDIFDNNEIYIKDKRILGKYILLGINGGFTFAPSAEWKDSFYEGKEPMGFIQGLELEYSLQSHLIVYLGYDYIEYSNITNDLLPSLIKRHFIIVGLTFKHPFSSPRHSYYSAGLGIGFNSLLGRSHPYPRGDDDSTYKSVSLEDLGTKMAIKTYVEAEAFIALRVILRLQFSYLLAMPFDLGPGLDYNYPKKMMLDFSGPALTFHLLYQILSP